MESEDLPAPDAVPANPDLLEDPRYRRVWDLHIRGRMGQAEVARRMGVHRSTISRRVRRLLNEGVPPVTSQEVAVERATALFRLDEIQPILMRQFLAEAASPEPSTEALARMNRELHRNEMLRARLVGTFAPTRIDVGDVSSDPVEGTVAKFIEQLERAHTPADLDTDDDTG